MNKSSELKDMRFSEQHPAEAEILIEFITKHLYLSTECLNIVLVMFARHSICLHGLVCYRTDESQKCLLIIYQYELMTLTCDHMPLSGFTCVIKKLNVADFQCH